jgi:hypothetical protein
MPGVSRQPYPAARRQCAGSGITSVPIDITIRAAN